MRAFFSAGLLIIASSLYSQTDSFLHDGIYRSYIVHTPSGWQQGDTVPLVFNLHGFATTAQQHQIYTLMDFVADTAGFIVVYPQGVNNTWDFSNLFVDDLGFINALIDRIHDDYGIDLNRVYACGMSNGAFMCHMLACKLSQRIAAIASVAGGMNVLQALTCSPNRPVPVFQIHGTADTLVPYNGSFGVYSVNQLIDHWRSKDGCSAQVDSFNFPDIVPFDQCTVTSFRWQTCSDNAEVWLYRVNNGGHTWPGTFPTIVFGPTNLDIFGSGEIWQFFNRFSLEAEPPPPPSATGGLLPDTWSVQPNPASDFIMIEGVPDDVWVAVFTMRGELVLQSKGPQTISTRDLSPGSYTVALTHESTSQRSLLVIVK